MHILLAVVIGECAVVSIHDVVATVDLTVVAADCVVFANDAAVISIHNIV